MSLELHAFVRSSNMPTKESWQARITELGFPIELDPEMKIGEDSGYSPCMIGGRESGFEIYFERPADILGPDAQNRESIDGRDRCISFRWGGDFVECACVLVASATLARFFDAVVYDPQEEDFFHADKLLAEAKLCLEEE